MPSDDTILLQEDESYDFTFELDENSESTDITATCYDSNDDKIDSDTNDVSSDDTQFTCSVDGGDYADTEQDIYVEMCDAAGNCQQSDTKTYVFDGSKPSLADVSTDVSTVNGNFTVDFTASDISGIEELEYFYDNSDVNEGDGNSVDISESDTQFTAGVQDIDKGEHTLYLRVKDGADRWSSTESIDINYLPNAEPKVSLSVPDNVTVSAGSSTSFDVTVENTGKLRVSEVDVSAEVKNVFSKSKTASDLKPGDTSTLSFDVGTSPSDLGKYTATVSTSDPDAVQKFKFLIEANSTQRENLEEKLSDWNQTLEHLRQNITALRSSGLSDSRKSRLQSNFSGFKQKMMDARQAYQQGEYYRVSSILEGIDSDYQTAKESYSTIQKEHRKAERTRLLLIGLGVFMVILAGIGAFFWQSEEYGLNISRFIDSDISIERLDDIPNRLRAIFQEEDEAEEFEWDGFR